jgi:hypothetical protein
VSADPGRVGGGGLATAGIILGILNLLLSFGLAFLLLLKAMAE